MPAVRGIDVARRATVSVCDHDGTHRGQGLLLDLGAVGTFVLTCHHVIAPLARDQLCVQLPLEGGQLSDPISAEYVAERSQPTQDAVVLQLSNVHQNERPLLHELNPDTYDGTLPDPATGLNLLETRSFQARVGPAIPLEVPVSRRGKWPNPPGQTYSVPKVHALVDPSDAREGISGSVVIYDGGVIGLAHFARAGGEHVKAEVYLVPLRVWAALLPELGTLIEPLVDPRLRHLAIVKRTGSLEPTDIVISRPGFRADIYLETAAAAAARTAITAHGCIVIIGRPKSGKTRLAWQLLQERADALVVIPDRAAPPAVFDASLFTGRDVILFFDDLHNTTLLCDPLAWCRRLQEAARRPCALICTARDGEDWRKAAGQPLVAALLQQLPPEAFVYTSRVGKDGADLTQAEGRALAVQLGLPAEQFEQRFDGTAGSLTLDSAAMTARYQSLQAKDRLGVRLSTLLDAAKLLNQGGLLNLREPTLRAAAAAVIVGKPIEPQAWRLLRDITCEEGFGSFTEAGVFQIYHPYLETSVAYQPTQAEVEALAPVLMEVEEHDGLHFLGTTLLLKYKSESAPDILNTANELGPAPYGSLNFIASISRPDATSEQTIWDAIEAGDDEAYRMLGQYLSRCPGRQAEAEQAYRDAIARGIDAYRELGELIGRVPGREKEAEEAFGTALAAKDLTLVAKGLIAYDFGAFLVRQAGREGEAESFLTQARDALPGMRRELCVQRLLGDLFARQAGRGRDAESVYLAAIDEGDELALLALADLQKHHGRTAEAEHTYGSAITAGLKGAHAQLALLLAQQSGREKDAEAAAHATIADGDDVRGHLVLGLVISRQAGREDEAEAAFRFAIDGGFTAAEHNLALLLIRQPGREAEAEEANRRYKKWEETKANI